MWNELNYRREQISSARVFVQRWSRAAIICYFFLFFVCMCLQRGRSGGRLAMTRDFMRFRQMNSHVSVRETISISSGARLLLLSNHVLCPVIPNHAISRYTLAYFITLWILSFYFQCPLFVALFRCFPTFGIIVIDWTGDSNRSLINEGGMWMNTHLGNYFIFRLALAVDSLVCIVH